MQLGRGETTWIDWRDLGDTYVKVMDTPPRSVAASENSLKNASWIPSKSRRARAREAFLKVLEMKPGISLPPHAAALVKKSRVNI